MSHLEEVVGGLALDLIGGISEAMEKEGDDPDTFNVQGAYLLVIAEDKGGDGWHFSVSNPSNMAAKYGLTEIAYKCERGEV